MENSRALVATESFSYSWLIDKQPTFSDALIFNNLKPKFPRNSYEIEENFYFDVPVITSPTAGDHLVHADEIFSDGRIKPAYVDMLSQVKAIKNSATSVPSSPVPLFSSANTSPFLAERKGYYILIGKWRRSSKKILQKCFRFVKPLLRKSSRVDDLERKVFEIRSFSHSVEASPRPSSAYSVVEYCSDFKKIEDEKFDLAISPYRSSNVCNDAENSVHEAILYCKRSIEK